MAREGRHRLVQTDLPDVGVEHVAELNNPAELRRGARLARARVLMLGLLAADTAWLSRRPRVREHLLLTGVTPTSEYLADFAQQVISDVAATFIPRARCTDTF